MLFLAAPSASLAADEGEPKKVDVTITTSEGSQVVGRLAGVESGKLTLATDPPQAFDLMDVDRLQFGAAPSAENPAGEFVWIGQDNHDLVQVGGAPGGNGIQDLHLRATGLAPKAVAQIAVVCRFPRMLRVWRLDTSQSPHWRLAIARPELSPQADLYLEPPADDSFGLKYEITVTYQDGATSKAVLVAGTHTNDELKVDRTAPAGSSAKVADAPATAAGGEVFLAPHGRLAGGIAALDAESVRMRASWEEEVQIPILHVQGIWFGNASAADARTAFDKQLAAPTAEDVVFVVGRDKKVAQVAGSVRRMDNEQLVLRFGGEDRAMNRDRLAGLVFAAHPKLPSIEGPYQSFVLAAGQSIEGRWTGWDGASLKIETPWNATWTIPHKSLAEIRTRNGKLVFLSDLDPVTVEETGYFGRVVSWARDTGFDGQPASLKGKQPAHVIAMHARSVLTYDLSGQFATFQATLGLDDSGVNRGRVACRVLVDGRELFAEPDLQGGTEPIKVNVTLEGAKQLTLEVDFGENADVGDRVLWAEPRLLRGTQPATGEAS
ncbi:MAG: NPCBM/NEW2 domain-containing protein [Pirellulales bacterium]